MRDSNTDTTNTLPPEPTQYVPPGSMSYEMRRELNLSEGPLSFKSQECAIVEYLPTVAHNHCWQGSVYSMPWNEMGRPGYFKYYCRYIGPERTHITLRSQSTPWSEYALRRIAEETGVTVLSNAEADAYLLAWSLRENERRSWPRWMKIVHLFCENILDAFYREPKIERRPTIREILSDPSTRI